MHVAKTKSELDTIVMELGFEASSLGFVPTMGALHEGHAALIRQSTLMCERTLVSIFVNPLQFDQQGDLDAYPRTLEQDLRLCEAEGADIVYCPQHAELYPSGFDTRIIDGGLGQGYEGSREGHFSGMLTVVFKLFQHVSPSHGFFGEKDFQQLQLIKRMVRDFELNIEIVPVPIIRESDGLARSSRNTRLSEAQRESALVLQRSVQIMQDAAQEGKIELADDLEKVRKLLREARGIVYHYADLVEPMTLKPSTSLENGPLRYLVACSVEPEEPGAESAIRLIDNAGIFHLSDRNVPAQYA